MVTAGLTVSGAWLRLMLEGLQAVGFAGEAYAGRKGWDLDQLAAPETRIPWKEVTVTANADLVTRIEGSVQVGATSGALAMRVRSELANNDLTVRKGSWCMWF
jgi:hypothetical protein